MLLQRHPHLKDGTVYRQVRPAGVAHIPHAGTVENTRPIAVMRNWNRVPLRDILSVLLSPLNHDASCKLARCCNWLVEQGAARVDCGRDRHSLVVN